MYIGVQRNKDTEQIVVAEPPSASFNVSFAMVPTELGTDFRGPFVHGNKGDRFLYVVWGSYDDGSFTMFARSKLKFEHVDPDLLAEAANGGMSLRCRVHILGPEGQIRFGTVRPPAVEWAINPT